ncbi:MAG: extracellular solute-binding protein [Anaerolineaceae bacterium]
MNNRISKILGYFVRLCVCLDLVLSLAACSTGGQTTPTAITLDGEVQEATTISTVEDEEPITSSSNSEEENVVITFASNEFERALYEPLMDTFHQENPSITVQFVSLPTSSVYGQVEENNYRTMAASADTALIIGRSADMGAYFRDLQPQIDSDTAFEPDDFWPDALTACQDAQGRVLGIPLILYFTGIFYDEAAFITAGLPVPTLGWTWDDFRQAATALTLQEGGTTRFGYADPSYNSVLQPFIDASLAKTDGEIDVNGLAQSLQWYVDLAKSGKLYPIQGSAGGEAGLQADARWGKMFQTNESPAMWRGRLQEPVPGLAGISEETDPATHLAITKYGIAPFPISADGSNTNTTPLVGKCVAISTGSLHPQAAWAWIKFLSRHWLIHDKTQMSELVTIPARQSVTEKESFWNSLPGGAEPAVRFGLEHAHYPSLYPAAQSAIYGALEKTLAGEANLVSALADANTKMASLPQQPVADSAPIFVATPQPNPSGASGIAAVNFYPGSTNNQELAAFKTLAEHFNQEHTDEFLVNISADYSFPANEGYFEGLTKSFDCFIAQVDPVGADASDVVLDLTPWMDGENSSFQQDYDPVLLNASRYDGELYDLPFTSQPAIMVYNADLLAKYGLQSPSMEWTFEEFLQQVTAVASISVTEKSYGFLPESQAVDTTDMLFAGRNIQWLDTTGALPVAKLDTPEMVNALTWLAGMYQSGGLFQSASGEAAWNSITTAVQSGQVAFWTALAGEQDELYFNGENPSFKIGIAPLPVISKSNGSFDASVERGFYISRSSQNPQACWSWAKYLSEQPDAFNGIPARKSVAASPAWESSVGADNAAIYRSALARVQTEDAETQSNTLKMPLESWKSQAEADVIRGNDPQQALIQAQQKADAYLYCLEAVDISDLNDKDLSARVSTCAKQADPAWK